MMRRVQSLAAWILRLFSINWSAPKCQRHSTPLLCLCRNKRLGWSSEWENSIGYLSRAWIFCCPLSIESNMCKVWKKLPSMCQNRVRSQSTMSHSASMVYSICAFWTHIYVIFSLRLFDRCTISIWFDLPFCSRCAASYGVEDPEFAITQLAQTTMRSELGKMSLDKVFRERECLNVSIVDSINKAALAWGITCLRYEIRDIKVSTLAAGDFVKKNGIWFKFSLHFSYRRASMKQCKCKWKPNDANVLQF